MKEGIKIHLCGQSKCPLLLKRLFWFVYFGVFHRRSLLSNGKFLNLRWKDGKPYVGIGATCFERRWWAGWIIVFLDRACSWEMSII